METTELLQKVRKIEIKTRGISNHIFAGEYHSAFKGRGMSFSEVREYQYGDDVRAIDWNVTARFNHPFIKVFEEERELTVMLLVDVSHSSLFGTLKHIRQEMITEICAVLAFSAINNNDKVGVIFFSDRVELFIPPKKGKSHILRIIRELLDIKPSHKKTNIHEAIKYYNNVIKKRSILFILSDFIDEGYSNSLTIAGRKHDVVGLRIHDPRDKDLPPIGLVQVQDLESGKRSWVDMSSSRVRNAYKERHDHYYHYFLTSFVKSGGDQVTIGTDHDYVRSLLRLFRMREKLR